MESAETADELRAFARPSWRKAASPSISRPETPSDPGRLLVARGVKFISYEHRAFGPGHEWQWRAPALPVRDEDPAEAPARQPEFHFEVLKSSEAAIQTAATAVRTAGQLMADRLASFRQRLHFGRHPGDRVNDIGPATRWTHSALFGASTPPPLCSMRLLNSCARSGCVGRQQLPSGQAGRCSPAHMPASLQTPSFGHGGIRLQPTSRPSATLPANQFLPPTVGRGGTNR